MVSIICRGLKSEILQHRHGRHWCCSVGGSWGHACALLLSFGTLEDEVKPNDFLYIYTMLCTPLYASVVKLFRLLYDSI